jgi:NAD(P)-dependent dehydrogenase (short-subunit alcohol dehydrogenase family)
VAVLEGLLPLLARGTDPSAVAISSNSATTQPGLPAELVDSCLAGDEVEARQVAARHRGAGYAGSKLALARWVRRRATTAEWAGAGVRLNAVAPGPIVTPMIEANLDFIMNLGDVFPVPQGRPGRPEQVASLLAYLLSPEAAFFCGSLIFMDGGTDAALRAEDWPVAKP